MTRSPTLYNVAVRNAYGTQWWGPYLSLAKAQARVKDEMSPNRDGERSAAIFRDGTEAPIAEYELVPRPLHRQHAPAHGPAAMGASQRRGVGGVRL